MRFSDPFGWVWGLATGVAPSHLRSPMQLYCRNPRTWPHVSERNRRVSSSEGGRSVSAAPPRDSKQRAGQGARLKRAIDAGLTGDKVPGFDPGAAPLGTDEESAGTPPVSEPHDRTVGSSRVPTELAADPNGNDRSFYRMQDRLIWPVIVVLILIVVGAALVAWLH